MAKKGNGILLVSGAALAATAIYFIRKGKAAARLQFLPKGVKLSGKFPSQKLEFLLDIVNPSDTALDVDAIFADVKLNGKTLGRIERNEKFTIQPLKTTPLNLPVKVSAANVPQFLGMLKEILQGKKDFTLDVEGTANAQGIDNEIKESYKLAI